MLRVLWKEHYGDATAFRVEDEGDFWIIFRQIIEGSPGNVPYDTILNAFKEKKLYGLKVIETEEMFRLGCKLDPLFCVDMNGDPGDYLLPCYCIMQDDIAEYIWVRPDMRRQGLGRLFVQKLRIREAWNPLPESVGFWESCGVETVESLS
ncbi:hypothetical protein GUITHDRAFT_114108 [Guillardia theta CCMP2712]|uniref:N-acetyltransferase domain-containing protein n=1 Tax=Guillardia theta (strain CCMP2712) TaxID=905079 RepID=L1IVF4_GUITC|nr:hypothetical protein GUITHDRAFT_114108 [Guillardia theta CCMP2712]EKX39859.1 hypothetical protein GUITHDRAFT_114108 [Guillardia theta CCMP2712]|eukprot:XP_005826839.1 hypothetical protein GUITHDRAFT_114108 [Guillardia theta CCMP2712]